MASHPRRIGPYDVEREIGRGGMGIVYLARDARLDRAVAIKALPEEFAADAERLARFTREAKLLASLNHPNIASIFGLEEEGGARYLVLEYVAGENLAERLARGALPVEEALAVCGQIAAGIEAAHEAGVIHRDLKPGNVILTEGGTAKVLDFGLARGGGEGADSASGLSHSPTMSLSATRAGVLLGTAAYMSPEQARGRSVDRRADVWAFGCVFYECLTGRTAFAGETVSDTLAAVLKSEPDWSALPRLTPRSIVRLLHRCLEKDARRRLRDIGDVRFEIEEALASLRSGVRDDAPAAAPPAPLVRRVLPWAIAAAAAVVALMAMVRGNPARGSRSARAEATHVAIPLPPDAPIDLGSNLEAIAISADGRRIAYIEDANHAPRIAVRSLNAPERASLAGTEDAGNPFFSADGQWIAYFDDTSLKKVPVTGGAPVKIYDAAGGPPGGCWARDGTIVFPKGWSGGLYGISANGGAPSELTKPDPSRGEVSHRWPQVLPDGRHVLFTVKTANIELFDDALIEVADMTTGEAKVVVEGGTFARYAAGHILYMRGQTLFAAPFDLARLEVIGAARPVVEGVMTWPSSGAGWFAVSGDGDLVYAAGEPRSGGTTLVWVDRAGKETPITSERRVFLSPRVAPDGSALVCWIAAANDKLWRLDLQRGNLSRLTSGAGNDRAAVWSFDSRRIAFFSDRFGLGDLLVVSADGAGAPESLVMGPLRDEPTGFSPDGTALAFDREESKTGIDIWIAPLAGDRTPRPFLASTFNEGLSVFSPDGRWLAFWSNESGQGEIYVAPYPEAGAKLQVSSGGGWNPRWSSDGKELFYRTKDSLAVAAVVPGASLRFGAPKMLFDTSPYRDDLDGCFDVSPDGERFVMVKGGSEQAPPSYLHLVLNWGSQLAP